MRRLLLVVLVALLVPGLPWWLGGEAKRVYDDVLAQLPAQGVSVVESRYERGWLGSHATTVLKLTPGRRQGGSEQALTARVESRIHHGPWRLNEPRLAPAVAFIDSTVDLETPAAELPTLRLDTVVALDGGGVTHVRIPDYKLSEAGKWLRVTVTEGKGEARFSRDFASGTGWLELPEVGFTANVGETVSLRNLRLESTGSRGDAGLLAGTGRLTVAEIVAKGPSGDVRANDVSVSGDSRPQGDLLDLHAEYRVAGLTIDGAQYAPSALILSFHRLAGPALASLQQGLNDLAANGVDPAAQGVAAAAIFAAQLPAILAAEPGLSLDSLEVTTPDGPVSGNLSLSVKGLTPETLQRRGAWLEHLFGDGELSAPEPLVLRLITDWRRRQVLEALRKQDDEVAAVPAEYDAQIAAAAAEQLADLARQGWVAREQGRVTTKVKLGDALLTINGKTLPLGMPGTP